MIATSADLASVARAGRRIGHVVEVHDVVGSTNDRARDLLAAGGADGVVVVAESQTAGRGRHGRSWVSPPGAGLFMSAAVEPHIGADRAGELALGTALAVAAACDPVAPVLVKWPNDVVSTDGRKVAGILIETVLVDQVVARAVIGIGVNVDWPPGERPEALRATATSLAELSGVAVDRAALLDRIIGHLSDEVQAIEDGRSPVARYRERCATLGQRVEAAVGDRLIEGVARDVDPTGALVVESDSGTELVTGGEVRSVRPLGA